MKKPNKITSIVLSAILLTSSITSVSATNIFIDDKGTTELPTYYSSRDMGYCSTVKAQKGNVCWAYATLASFESLLLCNSLYTTDYEPYAIDKWATIQSDDEGWHRAEGDRAHFDVPMGYLTSWEGPITTDNQKSNIGVTGIEYIGSVSNPHDKTHIKQLIIKNGAVTTAMNSTSETTNDNVHYCMKKAAGYVKSHAVSVVGWDDNYSKEHFVNTPENDGAWLCKNSWGTNNALGGYIWISYEDKFIFNMTDTAFAITNYQTIDKNTHLYQNEIYGATGEFSYINNKNATFTNIFDFSKNGNKLDKVVFETTAQNADYTIWFIPLNDNNSPTDNQTQWKKLGEGKTDYKGYICADIDDILLPKEKAGIAVTIDTANTPGNVKIGVSECQKYFGKNEYIFKDTSNYGESFIFYNNNMQDLKDYYSQQRNDSVGCHLVIKVITTGNYTPNIKGDYNLDGKLNIRDATLIQLYLAGLTSISNNQKENAGAYGKKLTINDVTNIQLALADLKPL